MQTVTNRHGQIVDVTTAEVYTLKDVVENRRDCGGGTHRERKVARRELRRRGYAWYVIFGETLSKDPETGEEVRTGWQGPEVHLLHEDTAKTDEMVWSRGCVSPSAAFDRWNHKRP